MMHAEGNVVIVNFSIVVLKVNGESFSLIVNLPQKR